MSGFRAIQLTALLSAVFAGACARAPALSFEAEGTLARYIEACEKREAEQERLTALPARERFAAAMKLLAAQRDPQNARFLQKVVAVMDRHHWPVPEEARRIRAERGGKTSAEDVAVGNVAAYLLLSGPPSAPVQVDKWSSQSWAVGRAPGGVVPFDLWLELVETVSWWCPDRVVRLAVWYGITPPADVATADLRQTLALFEAHAARREAALRNFFDSFVDRTNDGINVSVLQVYSALPSTTTFGTILYHYGGTLTKAGPDELSSALRKLRAGALASRGIDPSPKAQDILHAFIADADKVLKDLPRYEADLARSAAIRAAALAAAKGVSARDREALAKIATKRFARTLRQTPNPWPALTGSPDVKEFWVVGTADADGYGYPGPAFSIGITWEDASGKLHPTVGRDAWFVEEDGQWRLAGIRGIGSPHEPRKE